MDITAIIKPFLSRIHSAIEQGVPEYRYLLTGKLGLVLYYYSLYEAEENEEYADACIGLLQEVMDGEDVEKDELPPFFGTGFATGTAGLGYMITLVQKKGLAAIDLQEELQELDHTIYTAALEQIQKEERMDYLHGAMGAVHYFLLRAEEPSIRNYLEQLTAAFCEKAVQTPAGTWFRNYIIYEEEKSRIDLGISHGNAGFLLLMLQLLEKGIGVRELPALIRTGIQFIISQRIPEAERNQSFSQFPFSISSENHNDRYSGPRLAWCYGDLNIAWLLYRADALLQVPAWKELADEIVAGTAERKDQASTQASDSHFCHGTAGLAFFYQAISRFTGNAIAGSAAGYWLEETLKHLDRELTEGYYRGKETDLLNGLPGISLVLLSFSNNQALAWGRAFLL